MTQLVQGTVRRMVEENLIEPEQAQHLCNYLGEDAVEMFVGDATLMDNPLFWGIVWGFGCHDKTKVGNGVYWDNSSGGGIPVVFATYSSHEGGTSAFYTGAGYVNEFFRLFYNDIHAIYQLIPFIMDERLATTFGEATAKLTFSEYVDAMVPDFDAGYEAEQGGGTRVLPNLL